MRKRWTKSCQKRKKQLIFLKVYSKINLSVQYLKIADYFILLRCKLLKGDELMETKTKPRSSETGNFHRHPEMITPVFYL